MYSGGDEISVLQEELDMVLMKAVEIFKKTITAMEETMGIVYLQTVKTVMASIMQALEHPQTVQIHK